jgi:hypothetical protein
MNIKKNKHMIRTLLMVLFIHTISTLVPAQCNNQLVDIAASQSGKDAVFVREYKVRFKAGDKKQPLPMGHFSVLLKEGVTYRFNVADASEYEGKAVLQLSLNNQILGSTYNTETKTNTYRFDYKCSKTSHYQVLMSFQEAKEGCAVGILSMIVDSSLIAKQPADSVYEILYKDIWNPLFLNVPLNKDEHFEVNIDSGKLEKTNEIYSAYVSSKDYATIKITVIDNMNKPKETINKVFKVEELPLPILTLGMNETGFVSKSDIERHPYVELHLPVSLDIQPYTLIDYSVSNKGSSPDEIMGFGNRLSPAQLNLIRKLEPGSKLIFKNIRIRRPDGIIITLSDITFYLEMQ